jgi:hypothetical protein
MAGLDPAIQGFIAAQTRVGWMAASRAAMTNREDVERDISQTMTRRG